MVFKLSNFSHTVGSVMNNHDATNEYQYQGEAYMYREGKLVDKQ